MLGMKQKTVDVVLVLRSPHDSLVKCEARRWMDEVHRVPDSSRHQETMLPVSSPCQSVEHLPIKITNLHDAIAFNNSLNQS